MSLRQTILRPIARVGAWSARRELKSFMRAHEHTKQTQDDFLQQLLAAHRETAFGRDHGFAKIANYKDFTEAVPVRDYSQLRPYVDRVLQGETTALLPADQPVLMFSMTSGTTGEPKYIPVTQQFLDTIRRGWNLFGINVLQNQPDAWLRPIVQISSSMHEETSPTGLPCGAISGLLAQTQKKIVRRMYCTPSWITELHNPDTRFYSLLRYSIDKDVAFITTANPSSTIKLIETGQRFSEQLIRDITDGTFNPPGEIESGIVEKTKAKKFKPNPKLAKQLEAGIAADGKLLPRHFWNLSFLTNWTGGTLKLYFHQLRELYGDLPVYDIGLLASEGRFSVPLEKNTAAGVAEITSSFLEFIPAENYGEASPPILRAHELQVGAEYFLVVSNQAGLFRYNLDDRIRVTGMCGQSPVFEFLSRGLHTSSITGEKLTEHQVVQAMSQVRSKLGLGIERFVVQGRFAAPPHYELRLEADSAQQAEQIRDEFDAALRGLNIEYASKCHSDRLGPIQVVLLAAGTLAKIEHENIRRKKGRSEQYKHQYLLTEIIEER
ncbi:MAG: GH3 auxin-responsive promoter family protein [Phycisphaerae bacterium]|nr:GH3 auxin-responsive promoter family protein [Phycisphaerae bacterium]